MDKPVVSANGKCMKAWIQSVLVWLFVVITLILLFPIAVVVWVVTVPFDRKRKLFHLFTSVWASLYTWFAPFWKVTIENREKIDPDKVYVMISNHQSMLDILVLYRIFVHFKWVSKEENFKVPIVGWVMSMNRYVRLKRGKRSSILKMMEDGKKHLKEGSSLMIFPEGTRSETREMRRFREGAFRLAKDTGTPLLPIVLEGTGMALPKHGYIIRGKHKMVVRIMDEIPVETVREKTASEMKELAWEMMAGELEKIRENLR